MSTFVPGQLPGVQQILFRLRSFNANAATGAAGAQAMERLIPAGARFVINSFQAANGSISLTTATVSFGTTAGGAELHPASALSGVTGPTAGAVIPGTTTALARGYNAATQSVFASLGAAQGAAATCDLYVIGHVVP